MIHQPGRPRAKLDEAQELFFQNWFKHQADRTGIDPNPDHPLHQYDYRGAYLAGDAPVVHPDDGLPHWRSKFKDDTHPNRWVNGVDTRTEDATGPARPPIRLPTIQPADASRTRKARP